jgi:hypothetical protein
MTLRQLLPGSALMSSADGLLSRFAERIGKAVTAVNDLARVPSRARPGPVLLLFLVMSSPVTAEDITSSTAEDRRLFEQLMRPPWLIRAELAETEEIRRELYLLQPAYTRLGVAILQDIKRLEQRPAGPLARWAEALRRRYTSRAGMVVGVLAEARPGGRGQAQGLTDDETTVRRGGVQRRLIQLAITGRISEPEYESVVQRLQGQ